MNILVLIVEVRRMMPIFIVLGVELDKNGMERRKDDVL